MRVKSAVKEGGSSNRLYTILLGLGSAVLLLLIVVHPLTRDDISLANSSFSSSSSSSLLRTSSRPIATTTMLAPCDPKIVYRPAGLIAFREVEEMYEWLDKQNWKTGAEVGVQKGRNAKTMLSLWKSCEEFHLIDLWAQQKNYKDVANFPDHVQERSYRDAQKNVEAWKDKVHFHKMLSVDAAKILEDNSLDYIYVDARHDYCGVMEDMRAYWPKLRPGGVMAGHDYLDNAELKIATPKQDWGLCMDGSRNEGAVKGAVEDFAMEKGLTISVLYKQNHVWKSWVVQKPTLPHCVKETPLSLSKT